MNIYVANLSTDVTQDDLRGLFSPYGEVKSVHVVLDRETRIPRGIAFVEMGEDANAQQAMDELNGMEWNGKRLKVNQARPREAGMGGPGGGSGAPRPFTPRPEGGSSRPAGGGGGYYDKPRGGGGGYYDKPRGGGGGYYDKPRGGGGGGGYYDKSRSFGGPKKDAFDKPRGGAKKYNDFEDED